MRAVEDLRWQLKPKRVMANANRDLLTRGQRAARETMMLVTGSIETYGARGETFSADRRARLIDEAM